MDTIYESICQGKSYLFGGMELIQSNPENSPYVLNSVSSVGCDSITYLYLTVVPNDTLTIDTTLTIDELPFMYNDIEVLPIGTSEGIYTPSLSIDPCTTVQFNIEVILPTSVDGVQIGGIRIYPSIVETGESVTIDFGNMNPNNMLVEVYDVLGKRVSQCTPTIQVMSLNEFQTSGVFIIKVSSSNGDAFVEHLLVK
jgi:hypothetical protein